MESRPQPAESRLRATAIARGILEALVLALVCAAPWVLGAVHPAFEALLYAGVALVLLLWAICGLLEGHVLWRRCPVTACLGGLFLLGVFQMTPLPRTILARLSPAAVNLYEELLPAERESLPSPGTIDPVPLPAGQTLSLCPAGTRAELVRLLAVFVLFAAVRSTASGPAPLARLAVAATANGAALSLFAFLQFFSAPRLTVYWTHQVLPESSPFGPFICRNHFPFYVNMCIGLAVGLLLARRRDGSAEEASTARSWNPLELLSDPAGLWVSLALALMVAAVAFSLSRGGMIALACGFGVCLLLRAARSSRPARWGGVLLTATVALGLLAWLGAGPLRARLASLWEGQALEDERAEIWRHTLPAVGDFPLFGTGYGTFEHVEAAYRTTAANKGWTYEHAHNDYLEALIEGGPLRLLLSLASIALVYRLGWRALRRYRGQPAAGLVLGALVSFTTVAVHSAVDFGLHIPAIAALATVVAAHIAFLGEKRRAPKPAAAAQRWLALPAIAGAIAVALVLGSEGWRMAQAESLRLAAKRHGGEAGLRLIDAATQIAPERAALHLEAGQTYAARYDEAMVGSTNEEARQRAVSQYVLPALAHFVQARDLCPLSAKANLRLATHGEVFLRADAQDTYISRAQRLVPADPELHYMAGFLELTAGERERAVMSWRRSLALSPAYQEPILERARGLLTDRDLLATVLPDQPKQLFDAAGQLYADPGAPERLPFYRKALELLSVPGAAKSAADYHLKALLHEAVDESDEALSAYDAALARAPQETEWRFQYARLLRRRGRLKEARRQALAVLMDHPDSQEGRRLLEEIAADMAEKQEPPTQ
jgi:O-antigen ligase/tetratricopeptide (TPR) repeat protein